MKKIIITLGLVSALSLTALAQQPGGEKPQRPERPDPAAVASKMVADFDKDGNGSLNKGELEKAMATMRANRGPGGPGGQNVRPGGQQQQRPGAEQPQRQRPQAESRGQQTERPERPDMAEMFMKRNDANEDGELDVKELAGGLGQMNRVRSQPEGGRPEGGRPRGEK